MGRISLDNLGIKYGTDKSSPFHDYLNFYEIFFASKRDLPLKILEIGVFKGQSLSVWEEYFPKARIVGIDIAPGAKALSTERIAIEIADQSNVQQLVNISQRHGPFDIIIEDGSHMCDHQITTLKTVFPFLKYDGIYIIEDLQTNYGSMLNTYRGTSSITCVDYLKTWLDLRVGDEQIDIEQIEDSFLRTYGRSVSFMVFYRHACLIRKNWRNSGLRSTPLNDDILRVTSERISITAHLSNMGDKEEDGYINFIEDSINFYEIQGLSISSEPHALEYKVNYPGGSWSSWVSEEVFVGSRGKSALLRGAAVRVRSDLENLYSVRTTCRFRGISGFVEAFDGGEITSDIEHPLCAIQIDLMVRP